MRKFFNTVFFVTATLFFVIFALSNVQSIQLSFLNLQLRPVPVSLLDPRIVSGRRYPGQPGEPAGQVFP